MLRIIFDLFDMLACNHMIHMKGSIDGYLWHSTILTSVFRSISYELTNCSLHDLSREA
jgi:hypothetical protein